MQPNWWACSKCDGVFFAGFDLGVCPAGGEHPKTGPRDWQYEFAGDGEIQGQTGWRCCPKCQGLFFAGNNMGVCPTHSDDGSANYIQVGIGRRQGPGKQTGSGAASANVSSFNQPLILARPEDSTTTAAAITSFRRQLLAVANRNGVGATNASAFFTPAKHSVGAPRRGSRCK